MNGSGYILEMQNFFLSLTLVYPGSLRAQTECKVYSLEHKEEKIFFFPRKVFLGRFIMARGFLQGKDPKRDSLKECGNSSWGDLRSQHGDTSDVLGDKLLLCLFVSVLNRKQLDLGLGAFNGIR